MLFLEIMRTTVIHWVWKPWDIAFFDLKKPGKLNEE
jgi:hypothetical protein